VLLAQITRYRPKLVGAHRTELILAADRNVEQFLQEADELDFAFEETLAPGGLKLPLPMSNHRFPSVQHCFALADLGRSALGLLLSAAAQLRLQFACHRFKLRYAQFSEFLLIRERNSEEPLQHAN
jgi:hypothetical protein